MSVAAKVRISDIALALHAAMLVGCFVGGPSWEEPGEGPSSEPAVEPFFPTTTETAPPSEILRKGTEGYLLRGAVLTPSGVLDGGEVLVVDGTIRCVEVDCSNHPDAADATWIDTHATISPGLIDGHNHLSYNFLPEWRPANDLPYDNRYQWAEEPSYEAHIEPYSANRSHNSHFCPATKWGELRSLIHGTTLVQGQPSAAGSCIDWGVRNANLYHGLGHDHVRGSIASVRDLTDDDAINLLDSFGDDVDPVTRYHVHMTEGIAGNGVDQEFDSFAGRDPRPDRHAGISLISNTSVLIHGIGLTSSQLDEVADAGAKIVWSPSSNFALYGQRTTAPIEAILDRGITTGLGPDWTISGTDEMLSEMRFARDYGHGENIPALTPKKIWQMATEDGALVLGFEERVGRIEVGYAADITVFGRIGDPYLAVLESRAADVRLVMIGGEGFYGDLDLEPDTARNEYCESFDACGSKKFLCAQDSPTADNRRSETVAEIRTQLESILAGTGEEPYVEEYGRDGELLELVDCSL